MMYDTLTAIVVFPEMVKRDTANVVSPTESGAFENCSDGFPTVASGT